MEARSVQLTSLGLVFGVVLAVGTSAFPVEAGLLAAQASTTSNLRVGFLPSIDSLNPFRGLNEPSREFYGMVYDYLFSADQDGNLVPNLAVNATHDAYGANWTYQIRPGVTWSDGTSFSAVDVNFTINYNTQNFAQLFGYELYLNRVVHCRAGQTTGCGAVITSPGNVTVYFDRPFAAGKSLWAPILQKAQWSTISPQAAQYTFENPNPIGTGPFIADPSIYNEWVNNQPLHLTKNPNYHPVGNHVGPAHVDAVYLRQFPDVGSLAAAVRNGQIDLAEMPAAGIGVLQGEPNVQTSVGLQVNELFNEIGISQLDQFAANGRLNPARWDVNVRRSMAMSTNKDRILHSIYNGTGIRGTSLMSPVTPQWWYDPSADPGANLTYDLVAANLLLNTTGYGATWTDPIGNTYRMASRDITLSIQTNACGCPNPTNVTKTVPAGTHLEFLMAVRSAFPQEMVTAQFLETEYAKIGVKLDLKFESESALASDVYGGYVEMYIWNWFADPDPNYLLSIETGYTLDGWNDNYWDNATYNQLYSRQLGAFDLLTRQQTVRAAEKLHYESAVYVIYLYPFGGWAWRTSNLTGWGNWTAHPWRQPDADWGANPLFLDIHPGFLKVVVTGADGRPGHSITVTGALDATDNGTWTLDWGDGNVTTGTFRGGNTSLSLSHIYSSQGTYVVRLTGTTLFDTGSSSNTVIVDGTPPSTQASVSGVLGNGSWYLSPVTVRLSAADDLSGVATTSYRIDNGTWQTYTAPFPVTADGRHEVDYSSTDNTGNAEPAHALAFGIDTIAPMTTDVESGTTGAAGWYTSNVTVALTANDATSGIAKTYYSLDGGSWRTYDGPLLLRDGAHTISYRATDVAGNVEGTRSITIKVDTTPPVLHVHPLPAIVTSSTIEISWSGVDNGSGIAGYFVSVDYGTFQYVGMNESASLRLSDGLHVIQVRAIDAAGNAITQSVSVSVDTNVFSPSGPYAGAPTYTIIALAVIGVAFFLWRRRRKRPPKGE